jgi:hypothetical protein
MKRLLNNDHLSTTVTLFEPFCKTGLVVPRKFDAKRKTHAANNVTLFVLKTLDLSFKLFISSQKLTQFIEIGNNNNKKQEIKNIYE